MCGIAGVVSLGSSEVPSQDVIARMISNLDHRGPDANGVSRFDRCLLGNARLSIIDLQSGDQPMSCDGGRFTIVYNGELYNFNDIRHSQWL